MELFCNNEAMKLSRRPNDSLVRIGKVLDPGSVPRDGDYSNRGGKFIYGVSQPERWKNAKDIWISGFFRYGYSDDAVKVANLDIDNKTITTGQAAMYGFAGDRNFNRWYAYNLIEEIDQPGETCWTIEKSWFWSEDTHPKNAGEIATMIIDANNRNENFLLNVGPDKDGNFMESSIQILKEIGKLRESK
jgi:hypothetical protein